MNSAQSAVTVRYTSARARLSWAAARQATLSTRCRITTVEIECGYDANVRRGYGVDGL